MTTTRRRPTFRVPDRPEREPDDRTSYNQLADTGIIEPLRHYLGRQETTLITGDHYLCRAVTRNLAGSHYPDLLISFDADLPAYRQINAYIIAQQGKPPDFVLEIASARTGELDTGRKRRDYARLGIPEYWRFDETGQHHQTRLAADFLGPDGQYHPRPIKETPDGALQSYSPALNIILRWENGILHWYAPAGRPLPTFAGEHARANREQARADQEREARLQAEARVRELEARLQNLTRP